MTTRTRYLTPLAIALALIGASAAQANEFAFHIDLNVGSLTLAPNQPYYLDFQLNKGDLNLPNSAFITNFAYIGAGSGPSGAPAYYGQATGDIGSSVLLNSDASSPYNEFFQAFTPSTLDIQFDVHLSANAPANLSGIAPDAFEIAILDNSTFQIPTTDPVGLSLVVVPIGLANGTTSIQLYQSDPSAGAPAGVTASAVTLPDTGSTMALFGSVGTACSMLALRRRRAA